MYNFQELVLKCLTKSGKENLFYFYRDAIDKMKGLSAHESQKCLIEIEERGISSKEWLERIAEAERILEKHRDTPYLQKKEKLKLANQEETIDFSMLDYYEKEIVVDLVRNHAYMFDEALTIFNQYALPFYTIDDGYDNSFEWSLTLNKHKQNGTVVQEWLAHIAKVNRYLKE